MSCGLHMIHHNFMSLCAFGMVNNDLEMELYEKFTPVNNRKYVSTIFLHYFYLACHQQFHNVLIRSNPTSLAT